MAGRCFLIASAPFGPFSRVLARELRGRGAEVRRVVANAGDLVDWGWRDACFFRAPEAAWPEWIEVQARGATDVLLFGDSTPQAIEAAAAARRAGARLWVLENGYFRPHWITLEEGGVNAASGLPRDPSVYRNGTWPAPPPAEPVGAILPHHVFNLSRYCLMVVLAAAAFPHWRAPYAQSITAQLVGHVRRYFSAKLTPRRAEQTVERVLGDPARFFLALLQREGDSQLTRHSPLVTNQAFVERLLDSFARHAPADCRLVIKNHPLDPGVTDLGAMVGRAAATAGLGARVTFVDGGSLAALARASEGVVSVNSTGALAALGFRRPVKLLGRAFFDLPGLTDQKPLDAFWRDPAAPDHELFQRFRRHVVWTTQVNGSFHNPAALRRTCRNVADTMAGRAAAAALEPAA
nr:capsular biosynthesis protein [Caulobacter sp. 17J80-11]